jgi:hypothetical protein
MTLPENGLGQRFGLALLVIVCLLACGLILLLPAESFVTDLVYRAF